MNWYVVVTRDRACVPIERFASLEAAGNRIFYERAFDRWTVMCQLGRNGPMRSLTDPERQRLERKLYPGLFGE